MPVAHTALGDLQGVDDRGVAMFRGVPYAAPPIGELRFQPPAPPAKWNGLRDASRNGPIAPQLPSRLGAAMGNYTRPQDENCLTLTIATPAPDGRARPVLVWLHGGAWITGAGSLDWYDGAALARDGDVVVVGVNYRLGALGFLHHPAVSPGNLGSLDQFSALRWVRDHISSFGGDPARVTVMGQSAGGSTIGRLLLDENVRKLFQRAIIQSGSFGRSPLTLAQAAVTGAQFLRLLDIDPDSADAAARMRDVPPARLLQAQAALAQANARFAETTPPFMPSLPAPMTQTEIIDAIADGAAGKQIIIGATREEIHAFFASNPAMAEPDPVRVADRFAELAGSADAIERYRVRRPGGSLMELLADLSSDHTFLWPSFQLADALAARGVPVFAYRFDWAPPHSRFKACHCIDLPFTFGNFDDWPDAAMLAGGDPAQMQALSALMRRYWTDFMRDGEPGLPWPRYHVDHRATLLFDSVCDIAGDPVGLRWRA